MERYCFWVQRSKQTSSGLVQQVPVLDAKISLNKYVQQGGAPACAQTCSRRAALIPTALRVLSGQQALSGPVVVVGGATGCRVHVGGGGVHVVVVRVSSDA